MQSTLREKLDNAAALEKLYRDNKAEFKREFNTIYADNQDKPLVQAWHQRLNYAGDEISWGSGQDMLFVALAVIVAGFIAKLPDLLGINPDYYFPRNISFVILPILSIYFAWKHKAELQTIAIAFAVFSASLLYINMLPDNPKSDTLILACIHLPLLLWATLGFTFAGGDLKNWHKRLDYLRFNSDLVVMSALLAISGVIFTGITAGLFSLIRINIDIFLSKYYVFWAIPAVPIAATFIVRNNAQLVSKVSPVIAKVFTPLVLVMLVIYLGAVLISGKDPYKDREFLLMFNVLLLGVMALILFSIAETPKNGASKTNTFLLLSLSVVSILVNGIALSAIIFRIAEGGITPNRLAVLGGNVLILTHLLLVSYQLFKALKNTNELELVEKRIGTYLPVYAGWAFIVCFLFPLVFGFR